MPFEDSSDLSIARTIIFHFAPDHLEAVSRIVVLEKEDPLLGSCQDLTLVALGLAIGM